MKKLTIVIHTENEAFGENGESGEIQIILQRLIQSINVNHGTERFCSPFLYDSNGNSVGKVTVA